eukprot:TRINITY_DN4454_c1_g1_i15.p1 TRINITY_DN4454_c1_g1~~TRINITY_DN4454_c1_g1_i15.p1  ORF type:complete len:541 (-),score=186.84 TRINITY_DN4454_c1_g1_i15:815-2335(-)
MSSTEKQQVDIASNEQQEQQEQEEELIQRIAYENPLVSRYSSPEMSFIFSPQKKFSTWRLMWWTLAKAEHACGLEQVTQEMLDEMEANLNNLNLKEAEEREKIVRHDVMSHVYAYGLQCPKAKGIIHLGATSCFVGDNTDIVVMKEALELTRTKLVKAISLLSQMAEQYKDMPTLGFTHFQPAQLTTVGKRATLWLQDFMYDLEDVEHWIENIPLRGVKGTTGTQASYQELFDGSYEKVVELDEKFVEMLGFKRCVSVSGQTYTRKVDYKVLSVLSGIAQSAYKMAGDIRLLMHLKEIEEPFGKKQIGSSAMAYKRNPMRCERICSLSRYVMSLVENTAQTHSNQWFERTLDDSANRRIVLPEAFLGIDVVLGIVANVIDGIHVWPQVVRKHVDAELPFMATEKILMECVKAGGDRQELHELIREHSMEAAKVVKGEGGDNDLLERLRKDEAFACIHDQLDDLMDPSMFIGCAVEQVDAFLSQDVKPILEKYTDVLEESKVETLSV